MADTKKVSEVDGDKFRDEVDKVVHERGDGSGPAQYPHEVDTPDAFEPEVTVVPTEDPNVTSEVHVVVDKVIPLVTQDDPAGYGTLSVPIHDFVGAKTVEQRFAEEGGGEDKSSKPAPAKSAPKS